MPRKKRDAIDERFGPILDAMDAATEPFDLRAGESIYMLTLLLLGSIKEAPADIRELFVSASVQCLLGEPHAGQTLRALCLDGVVQE